MDELNNDNNQEQKSAPTVAKLSLDELNAIKNTIAPVRSKSEEEMLYSDPSIDPNTVYSSYKPSNNQSKVENVEAKDDTIDTHNDMTSIENSESTIEENSQDNTSVDEQIEDNTSEVVNDKTESIDEIIEKIKSDSIESYNESVQLEDEVGSEDNEKVEQPEVMTSSVGDISLEATQLQNVEEQNVENKPKQKKPWTVRLFDAIAGIGSKKKKDTQKAQGISQAQQSAPATTSKIDLSEIQAVKSTLKIDENGKIVREPIDNQEVAKTQEIVREYSDADGDYDKKLDFEKNKDVKKFKLPLPKLPFIIAAGVILLVGLVIMASVMITNAQKNRVYVTGYELSIMEITGGYVGDTVDLSGVYIIKNYSNGQSEKLYNIKDYIKNSSKQINENSLLIVSASEMSYISFNVDGAEKDLFLTVRTLDKSPTKVSEVKLTNYEFTLGDTILFENMIVKVETGEYGTKLLTIDEIKNNLNILYRETPLQKTDSGFVINIASLDASYPLVFAYTELGVTKRISIAFTMNGNSIVLIPPVA